MQFRTEIYPSNCNLSLSHKDRIVFFGSCFTENISNKFLRYRFPTTMNSHGIIFNPQSIATALNDCIDKRRYKESDLVMHSGKYCSVNHHGKFNNAVCADILVSINDNIECTHSELKQASVLFITFGSAYAYTDRESNEVVANCHKIPQTQFSKILLDHQSIEKTINNVFIRLINLNPTIQIVLTVSPVRHWKDGVQENQLSKSHLIVACHNLASIFSNTVYFPSYELVMDDLRDYRFYEKDMLHPNSIAVDYIWGKLKHWCINTETLRLMEKMEPLIMLGEHRSISSIDEADHKIKILENESKILDLITKQRIK